MTRAFPSARGKTTAVERGGLNVGSSLLSRRAIDVAADVPRRGDLVTLCRDRCLIDVLPMPELEHEKHPQMPRMIPSLGQVIGEHFLDKGVIEVAALPRQWRAEDVAERLS